MSNLNYIPYEWKGDWSIDEHRSKEILELLEQSLQWLHRKGIYDGYTRYSFYYSDLLIWNHLCGDVINGKEEGRTCIELIRRHYFDTWYKPRSDEAKEMRKAKGNKNFRWYKMLSQSVWICLMHDETQLLADIADWTESWFEPEWQPVPVDPLLAKMYIVIAASFRTKALKGQDELEAEIRKSRKKAPKLLLAAWDTAREGDQQKFDAALLASTEHFIKSCPEEQVRLFDYIAFGQSTVLAAARRLGLQVPDFGPEIMAYLPTSESVGLPSPRK